MLILLTPFRPPPEGGAFFFEKFTQYIECFFLYSI
ncbi:MAG: hypothetical protein [Chaetfec virus UA24_2285]|nr:MAG: hypothetical protein [Chaetfec virus UA24_2285]